MGDGRRSDACRLDGPRYAGRVNRASFAHAAALAAALALASCAYTDGVTGRPAGSNPDQPLPTDWRTIATPDDRRRARGWRDAFVEGLARARAAGHAEEIAAEGALLVPDAGLIDPRPPAGDYRCRVIKLGAKSAGPLDYIAYDYFRCRIDDDGVVARFAKTSGSQRQIGTIYPENRMRMVFLGTLELGDETRTHIYGADADRDLVGAVERIGERRWRIVFPYPRFESLVDVLELIPAG